MITNKSYLSSISKKKKKERKERVSFVILTKKKEGRNGIGSKAD